MLKQKSLWYQNGESENHTMNDLIIEIGANGLGILVAEKNIEKVWDLVNTKVRIFSQPIRVNEEDILDLENLDVEKMTQELFELLEQPQHTDSPLFDIKDEFNDAPLRVVESFLNEEYPHLDTDYFDSMYVQADENYLAFDADSKKFIETKDLQALSSIYNPSENSRFVLDETYSERVLALTGEKEVFIGQSEFDNYYITPLIDGKYLLSIHSALQSRDDLGTILDSEETVINFLQRLDEIKESRVFEFGSHSSCMNSVDAIMKELRTPILTADDVYAVYTCDDHKMHDSFRLVGIATSMFEVKKAIVQLLKNDVISLDSDEYKFDYLIENINTTVSDINNTFTGVFVQGATLNAIEVDGGYL